MALCCTGVVFLAGGKLLDAVRPAPLPAHIPAPPRARHSVSRSRPRFRRRPAAARSRGSFRKD
jgi:hypothetical protein